MQSASSLSLLMFSCATVTGRSGASGWSWWTKTKFRWIFACGFRVLQSATLVAVDVYPASTEAFRLIRMDRFCHLPTRLRTLNQLTIGAHTSPENAHLQW